MTEDAAVYETLAGLAAGVEAMGPMSPAYWDRMMHRVPDVPCVDRVNWLVQRLQGKTVWHLGCCGPLHAALLQVCPRVYGVDQDAASYPDYTRLDLETAPLPLPAWDVQVVLLGEVLEHLTCPGALLRQVRDLCGGCEVLITVPNAGAAGLQQHLRRGYENVHREHVAWYSWRTLTTLVERCGFAVQEWYWCGGKPLFAEGLLFVVRGR